MVRRLTVAAHVVAVALLVSACSREPSTAEVARLAALAAQIDSLEQRKSRLEDINAIERLQHAYGYYVDRALWDDVAALFADDGTIEIGLDGVYVGKERVREYLHALGGGRQGSSTASSTSTCKSCPSSRWRRTAVRRRRGGARSR